MRIMGRERNVSEYHHNDHDRDRNLIRPSRCVPTMTSRLNQSEHWQSSAFVPLRSSRKTTRVAEKKRFLLLLWHFTNYTPVFFGRTLESLSFGLP